MFVSNRSGHDGIYRQSIDQETPEPLVVGPEDVAVARVSPDGAWVVYRSSRKRVIQLEPVQILRSPIAGGPSQLVLMARPDVSIACARSPASLCVVGEPAENRKQLVFTAFDVLKGRGAELAKADIDPKESSRALGPVSRWQSHSDLSSPQGPIRVLALDGRPTLEIRVKGWSNTRSLRWAADGNCAARRRPGAGHGRAAARGSPGQCAGPLAATRQPRIERPAFSQTAAPLRSRTGP